MTDYVTLSDVRGRVIAAMPWPDDAEPDYSELEAVLSDALSQGAHITARNLAAILPGFLPQHGAPPFQFWLDTAQAMIDAALNEAVPETPEYHRRQSPCCAEEARRFLASEPDR